MKIGFVSRIVSRDLRSVFPQFASRLYFYFQHRTRYSYTIFAVAEECLRTRRAGDADVQSHGLRRADQPEGKYVIMRDPNRAIVRIYGVPVGTFEDSDGSDDDGEDGSGSDNDVEDEGQGNDEEE